jgi:hypothetical protein
VASAPTEAWLDHPLRYVGYGVSGDEATDAGIKRRADIPLEGWDDQWLFARDPEGEANLCWGDSGGAALLPMGDGSFVLAGVQSWIWDDDDTPCAGGQSGAARVDAHLSWIEEHASPVTVTLEEEEEAEPDPEGEDTSAPDLDGSGDTGSGPSPGDAPDGDRSLLPADESTAEPDESTHLGGFGPAPAGCRHVPAPGAPWLPALVAALATLGLGRRRRA